MLRSSVAGADFPVIHARNVGDHPVNDFRAGHFQGEEEDAVVAAVAGGDVVGEVLGEGGFTHGWAGANDDEIAFLEAGGFVIKVAETGFETAQSAFVAVEFFNAIIGIHQQLTEGGIVGFDGLVRDGEELFLGGAQEFGDVGSAVVGGGGDVGAGANQTAAQSGLSYDVGVGVKMGGGGDEVGKFGEVGRTADVLEGFLGAQLTA